jgi:hypothetical protein
VVRFDALIREGRLDVLAIDRFFLYFCERFSLKSVKVQDVCSRSYCTGTVVKEKPLNKYEQLLYWYDYVKERREEIKVKGTDFHEKPLNISRKRRRRKRREKQHI